MFIAANSPSGTIADSDTFTYNKNGQMLTAVSGRYNNTVTNVYNAAGQTTSESLAISSKTYTTAYEYNAIGQRTKLTYPDTSKQFLKQGSILFAWAFFNNESKSR